MEKNVTKKSSNAKCFLGLTMLAMGIILPVVCAESDVAIAMMGFLVGIAVGVKGFMLVTENEDCELMAKFENN